MQVVYVYCNVFIFFGRVCVCSGGREMEREGRFVCKRELKRAVCVRVCILPLVIVQHKKYI